MKLEDDSPMPFGKYKGQPMQNVPASYLHWLWHDANKKHEVGTDPVADYIKDSLSALKEEAPDLIWS